MPKTPHASLSSPPSPPAAVPWTGSTRHCPTAPGRARGGAAVLRGDLLQAVPHVVHGAERVGQTAPPAARRARTGGRIGGVHPVRGGRGGRVSVGRDRRC